MKETKRGRERGDAHKYTQIERKGWRERGRDGKREGGRERM
jgi:hypothetical protein